MEVDQRAQGQTPPARRRRQAKAATLCATPPTCIKDKKQTVEYTRLGCLGEGGFARCFKVVHRDGRQFAAKVVAKASLRAEKARNKLFGEIKVHQNMKHPNIVSFYECFEDSMNVYMILELCENRTLAEMLRRRQRLTESEVRYFVPQLLGAVKYMHGRHVIHRDLKLGNLLLDRDMRIKVADFGLAALLKSSDERKMTICGTPNYIAPEVLFGKEDGHSFEVDLWSIGVIMYALLVGKPPFQSKDIKAIYNNIRRNYYVFPTDVNLSQEAIDLINSLLTPSPHERPSLDKIADHPFFHAGIFPRNLSVDALCNPPNLFDITPEESRANWGYVTTRAGIGPGTGLGESVADYAGESVSLLIKEPCEKQDEPEKDLKTVNYQLMATKIGNILPHALSPRQPPPVVSQLKNGAQRLINSHVSKLSAIKSPKRLAKMHKEDENFGHDQTIKRGLSTRPLLESNGKSAGTIDDSVHRPAHDNLLRKHLFELINNIRMALARDVELPRSEATDHAPEPIFITKWVDYSYKYGLGYELSTGEVGVNFNDNTCLILSKDGEKVTHFFRKNRATYMTSEVPVDLLKKLNIMKSFKGYMLSNCRSDSLEALIDKRPMCTITTYECHRLYGFFRTKTATLFYLSNKSCQINFKDHTKIMMHEDGTTVDLFRYNPPRLLSYPISARLTSREGVNLPLRMKVIHDHLVSWQEKLA